MRSSATRFAEAAVLRVRCDRFEARAEARRRAGGGAEGAQGARSAHADRGKAREGGVRDGVRQSLQKMYIVPVFAVFACFRCPCFRSFSSAGLVPFET